MTLLYRTIKTVNSRKTCGPQKKEMKGEIWRLLLGEKITKKTESESPLGDFHPKIK
jgi:hypothetical protein